MKFYDFPSLFHETSILDHEITEYFIKAVRLENDFPPFLKLAQNWREKLANRLSTQLTDVTEMFELLFSPVYARTIVTWVTRLQPIIPSSIDKFPN